MAWRSGVGNSRVRVVGEVQAEGGEGSLRVRWQRRARFAGKRVTSPALLAALQRRSMSGGSSSMGTSRGEDDCGVDAAEAAGDFQDVADGGCRGLRGG